MVVRRPPPRRALVTVLAAACLAGAAAVVPPPLAASTLSASPASTLIVTPESFVEGDYNTYAVFNGSHTQAYHPTNPSAVVHARSEVVAFLMQATRGPNMMHGPITVMSSNPAACVAKIEGPALKVRRIQAQARRMFVKLDCLATSMTWVTITVTIDVIASGVHTPVSFGFKKKCAGDALVPGFDVTLGAFADADGERSSSAHIVHNGETGSAYSVDEPSARITYDTTDVHVYIAMANSSTIPKHPFGTPVTQSSEPWCRVLLSGPAARGGEASASALLLVFKFDCSGSGTAKVTVTLPLPDHAEGIQFAFLKECRAGEIPGFDVTLSSYEPGVRASYAVKNGEATSAYHAPKGTELPLAVVREAQSRTSFYLQMSTFHSLEFEPPIVRSSDPFCLVSASGDAASGGWVDDISSQLIVNFNCIDSGTALVTVTVPLQVHERVVNASFAFRKECRWTSTPGFDVTLGAWIKNEGGTYAVRNGAATPAFSLWDPKAIVRARSYSSTFYLQMSTPDEQEFEWPTAESSDPMVKVTLGGPASKGGKAKPPAADKPPMALVVKYDCMKTGSSTITVTIPLGPWNEAAFSFVKECSVGEIPGFDVTLGAWVPGDHHSYAIKNGAPMEAYDASAHTAIIRAGTPSYTFYLMNSGGSALTVDTPSVEVKNRAVSVNVSGDALSPGPLGKQARSLVLDFNCAARAKTDVIIQLRVSAGTVAFGFRKDCKPLTVRNTVADTPHEVRREAERITSREGASSRLSSIALGVLIGLAASAFQARFFGQSPQAKGYQRAKVDD